MKFRKKLPIWLLNSAISGFDTDAVAWFNYATITDPAEQAAINAFIIRGKAFGWWSKLLRFYYFSPAASAFLKDIKGLTTGTNVSSCTQNADGSISFNGSSQYVRTGLLANAGGLSLTSGGLVTYCTGGNNTCAGGSTTSSTQDFSLYPGAPQP